MLMAPSTLVVGSIINVMARAGLSFLMEESTVAAGKMMK